jgi:hypothetical protein
MTGGTMMGESLIFVLNIARGESDDLRREAEKSEHDGMHAWAEKCNKQAQEIDRHIATLLKPAQPVSYNQAMAGWPPR